MKLFIRCERNAVGRAALLNFVRRALRGPWYTGFRPRGKVVDCHIVRVMDRSGRRIEYHGLVDVRPAREGWELVQRLDGQPLLGSRVRVRKWFDRSGRGVDRRKLGGLSGMPKHFDRRRGDERRRLVRLQLLDDMPDPLARERRHPHH